MPKTIAIAFDRPNHAKIPANPPRASNGATEVLGLDTIQGFAKLSARLALYPNDRAAILRYHNIDEPAFAALEKRWNDSMNEEARRTGSSDLRKRHDYVYVRTLEAKRGPITLEDRAALLIAGQLRTVDATLEYLRIPRASAAVVNRYAARLLVDRPHEMVALRRAAASLRTGPMLKSGGST